MRLAELASALGATLHGDPEIDIGGVAGLGEATAADLSFVANPRYTAQARTSAAGAIVVEPDFEPLNRPTLRVANPYLAFTRAATLFYKAPHYSPGIHPTAVMSPSATLGKNIHIGPYVVVGDGVEIGNESILLAHCVVYAGARIGARLMAHAHAVIREGCVLGDDVILGNGVIVGGDGFGFARDGARGWVKIPQAGPVVIGDHVEIQSNACIDRASVGTTRIASGAKIDNLVQVGHGSTVGEHTLLCAQVGLAGSSAIGRNVILAGQVGVAGHLTVGDGAIATAQTGIPSDVAAGATVSGYPAIDNRAWLRSVALFNRLPDVVRKLRERG